MDKSNDLPYSSIEAFDTYAIFYTDYCKLKEIVKDAITVFTLKVCPEFCNNNGYIDYGVLLTMVDGLSSYSQKYISKNKSKSLSVNLNIKVFRQLEPNKEYEMTVEVYSESSKYTCFKCQIFDLEEKLMCIATHVKRSISPKF